jgi:hypothetical protein
VSGGRVEGRSGAVCTCGVSGRAKQGGERVDLLIESPPRTVKEDRGGEEELREAHHQKTCVEWFGISTAKRWRPVAPLKGHGRQAKTIAGG